MYKIFKLSAFLFVALVLFSSCKKDGEQLNLQEGKFTNLSLYALPGLDHIILSASTENSPALTFKWQPADFGPSPVISYTLQLDKLSDTSNGHHWENAVNINIDKNTLQY